MKVFLTQGARGVGLSDMEVSWTQLLNESGVYIEQRERRIEG